MTRACEFIKRSVSTATLTTSGEGRVRQAHTLCRRVGSATARPALKLKYFLENILLMARVQTGKTSPRIPALALSAPPMSPLALFCVSSRGLNQSLFLELQSDSLVISTSVHDLGPVQQGLSACVCTLNDMTKAALFNPLFAQDVQLLVSRLSDIPTTLAEAQTFIYSASADLSKSDWQAAAALLPFPVTKFRATVLRQPLEVWQHNHEVRREKRAGYQTTYGTRTFSSERTTSERVALINRRRTRFELSRTRFELSRTR